MPSQRGLPAAQGRSLRRRGPRGFTSRCSPSRRRFRRLDTASAPRPLTNGHLLGHSQTDAAPPLSRSALRSELRPPGRAAIRVISTSSLHLKRGTTKLSSSQPIDSPYRRTLSRVCSNAWLALLGAIDRNGDVESRGRRCQIDGRLCRTNIRFQRQSVSLQKRLKVTVERLLQRRYRPAAFATL